jgi:predicted phage terminase large subunit-like protein
MRSCSREECNKIYVDVLNEHDTDALRRLCREDLFFLLTVALNRPDANKQWLFERCREVEAEPDGFLDLWSREHYKSTVITFAKTIQDNLKDPENTFGIFSHTRPIAKGFLSQIKREYELNEFLKDLFPDILWRNPQKESPSWSLDGGILLRRKSNPKEATIEAWGLVDGQPTSKHFRTLVYDDVVTRESVTTPEQIQKTTDAFALSLNLGAKGGVRRGIGTRYHLNDTYRAIKERNILAPRLHPATKDGTRHGEPVLWTKEEFEKKMEEMGPYIGACQLLQNPKEDGVMGFEEGWLRYYTELRNTDLWNFYILVDGASEKKKTSDYTVIVVIALGPDNNYYLVDGVRDRLNLTERTNKLFEFHRRYRPIATGYEKYGKDSDIEHIKYVMEQENYRFEIKELGGAMPKNDRIRRLVPIFEKGRFYIPTRLIFVDREKKARDFIRELIQEEYLAFPVGAHDDMMDAISRIVEDDLKALFPEAIAYKGESVTHNTGDVNTVQTDYKLFD